ncbi:hypothetical protein A2609_03275 [Candidatus Kaiserbacteria bacterium RIFOXYD1_FULL_47_14]|uniref:Uncharacterized protein n=1 Tax=Candidatus Kaiserbacteria bacterium RIFOXYD1_FULL_47_14 TaxID=1798533 RepID=A0A1F6G3T0_9BACT|nr:MAG: hypothetical protein A2609_03275 [Candidatus Kaiserbacteria bacterium RIFOXYD1_FULL_47_14]
MSRTATDIPLSRSNFTALLVTLDALKACLGQGTEFTEARIHQEDNTCMRYKIGIWGNIFLERKIKENFQSFVTFTLKQTAAGLRPDGLVKVKIIGWNNIFEVQYLGSNATGNIYCVTEGSEPSLRGLKEVLTAKHIPKGKIIRSIERR